MGLEPARHAGHHRRDDRRRAGADQEAEQELERGERRRMGRQRQARRQGDAPVSGTARGPTRSERLPHAMLAKAMARKPMVMALDTPVTDQPVAAAIGRRSTGSENIEPIATQPIRPPAATITQR